jgi:hypothetical protein
VKYDYLAKGNDRIREPERGEIMNTKIRMTIYSTVSAIIALMVAVATNGQTSGTAGKT